MERAGAEDSVEIICDIRVKKEDDKYVTLKVQKQGCPDYFFTMKRDEPLRKLMISFCERREIKDYRTIMFSVDGDRVRGNQTPTDLELEDEDIIDAWELVTGGAPFN